MYATAGQFDDVLDDISNRYGIARANVEALPDHSVCFRSRDECIHSVFDVKPVHQIYPTAQSRRLISQQTRHDVRDQVRGRIPRAVDHKIDFFPECVPTLAGDPQPFFDTLALYFNRTHPSERGQVTFEHVPSSAEQDATIAVRPRDSGVYEVSPFPFAAHSAEYAFAGRPVEPGQHEGNGGWSNVLAKAPTVWERFRLVPA